jgi:hypothetical protein
MTSLDRRFALIAANGDILFPYMKAEQGSDRVGFALSAPGERDARGQGTYTRDLAEVIRRVVFDGWKVRARSVSPAPRRDGSYGLGKQAISQYWLSSEMLHLAQGASVAPLAGPLPSPPPLSPAAAWPFPVGAELDALEEVSCLTVEDFTRVLSNLQDLFSATQRQMLVGQAQAPGRMLSMQAVARLAGYETYSVANSQYGGLAGRFAEAFGIEGLENQMQALAEESAQLDALGHSQWVMRPALAQALVDAGLIEPTFNAADPTTAAALKEIEGDPAYHVLDVTTRQALVNARLGQGGYRRRMLTLWNGRCAVTGCSIEAVLVASHAKPWAQATNSERLDHYNGLLLSASLDRLFDRGLISFANDGRMLFSAEIDDEELARIGISRDSTLRSVHERHLPFLASHRAAMGFEN